jgi:hypothetical protein
VVADRLGIERAKKSREELGLEVRNCLEADGDRCLIVFDNVTNPDAIAPYVPSMGAPQVLITSTESAVTALGNPVQVDVFTEGEALAFLAARTRLDDEPGARTLAGELGYLPLALSQATAVIAARHLTYPVYLDRLRSYPVKKYLPAARGEPYPSGVAEAIALSIDTITAIDPADSDPLSSLPRALLDVISLLSPDGVSREVLYVGASAGVFGASPEDLDEGLARLSAASLLAFTADASTVVAHRLVMRVTRERAADDDRLTGVARKVAALLYACSQSKGEFGRSRLAAGEFGRHVEAWTANVTFEHRMPLSANGISGRRS